MIELKITTLNKAVLLATSRYFADLAEQQATVSEDAPRAVAAKVITAAALLPLPLANVEEDEEEAEEIAEEVAPLPPVDGLELDADGFPWDHRIHASTKSKVSAGTWKVKPKTDPALVEAVRAEYLQTRAAPFTPAAPAVLPPVASVEPAPMQPAPPALTPPVLAPAPLTEEKPTNPAILFTTTLKLYAEVEKAGKIAPGSGEAWAKQVGLPSVASLVARPDLCGQFYDQLKALL